MTTDRCDKLHQTHRELAARHQREFNRVGGNLSVSVKRRDITWSSVIELSCMDVDGKSALNVHYGLRHEPIEEGLGSPTSHSPTLSKFVALNPLVDQVALSERLDQISVEVEQTLRDVKDAADLVRIIDAQGGATLVFGSWTHSGHFAAGRSADEIRRMAGG